LIPNLSLLHVPLVFLLQRDPVYGAVFSNLLLGETLGGADGWAGAFLITVAAATNALLETSAVTGNDDDDVVKRTT